VSLFLVLISFQNYVMLHIEYAEYNTNNRMILHRASNSETVISLVEDNWSWLSDFFPKMKPGSLVPGNKLSLTNIITTEDMLGLSSGCSWTHKRPTWMQCNISEQCRSPLSTYQSVLKICLLSTIAMPKIFCNFLVIHHPLQVKYKC
jgi:hypothetical protein